MSKRTRESLFLAIAVITMLLGLMFLVSNAGASPERELRIKNAQLARVHARMAELERGPVFGWTMLEDYSAYQVYLISEGKLLRRIHWLRYTIYDPDGAVEYVFGPYSGDAKRVMSCESHKHVFARNGQFLGLFQMGSSERGRYGHGNYALAQVRAAYRYFVASHRSWGPWECKP